MRDLSKPLGTLVPSSQEGGNLVQGDLAAATMTAPGSDPVTPLPPPIAQSHPQPNPSAPVQDGPLGLGDLIPVADTSKRIRTDPAVPQPADTWQPTPAGQKSVNVPYPSDSWEGTKPDA